MSKKVAVLFSGGLDSTYLVWKNLTDGNEVQPIYVEIENNKIKTILEKNRTKLLVNEFRKDNDFVDKIHDVRNILKVNVDAREDSLLFKQVPVWILAIVFAQDLNVDEIQIGYVANDDAIGYLQDIQNVYKSYEPLMRYLKPLVFPLSKEPKYKMAHSLPEIYRKFIFSCENATIVGPEDAEFIEYEPCCECTPCTHAIQDEYYGLHQFPDNYKKNLLRMRAHAVKDMGFDVVDKEGRKYEYWNGFEGTPTLDAKLESKIPYQMEINFPVEDYVMKADEDLEKKESLLDELSKAKEKEFLLDELSKAKEMIKLKEINVSNLSLNMFKEFNG
jgi:7-cyano-7-deazaguanine synthase in queuosine biosynthesis